jgi:hypothetical protein
MTNTELLKLAQLEYQELVGNLEKSLEPLIYNFAEVGYLASSVESQALNFLASGAL